MAKFAYVFPGQGSQQVGMGRDLYENFSSARAVFDQADSILGFPISTLCFEGPEPELTCTVNAQPAVVAVSFACLEAFREVAPAALSAASFVAGHSVGEYTALVASGVVDFAAALELARRRGQLMYEAGLAKPGDMAAIIGMDQAQVAAVCEETGVWIANVNGPGQVVISGEVDHVKNAAQLAKSRGAKLVIPLAVSGAFHSPLMQQAVDGMSKALSGQRMQVPQIPIVGNVDAHLLDSAESVKAELLGQLCSGVQWLRSVEFLIDQGVSTFVEIGPGDVLSGLIENISPAVTTMNIGDAEAVQRLATRARESGLRAPAGVKVI